MPGTQKPPTGWLQPSCRPARDSVIFTTPALQHCRSAGHCGHRAPPEAQGNQGFSGPIYHRSRLTRVWRLRLLTWEFGACPKGQLIRPCSNPLPLPGSESHGLSWTLTKAVCEVSRTPFSPHQPHLHTPATAVNRCWGTHISQLGSFAWC